MRRRNIRPTARILSASLLLFAAAGSASAQSGSGSDEGNSKAHAIYKQAQQRDLAYKVRESQFQPSNDWRQSGPAYALQKAKDEISVMFVDVCRLGHGPACIDYADRLPKEDRMGKSYWLDIGCQAGHRPACRNPTELAKLEKRERDARAPMIGTHPTAEESRLEDLCSQSQWASCAGYSRLAAPRLLQNCDLGNQSDCVTYSYKTLMSLSELRAIWGTKRALVAMERLCRTWSKPADYKLYCGTRELIAEQIELDALPRAFAGSTRAQRAQCIRAVNVQTGYLYEKTGAVGLNSNGDRAEETRLVSTWKEMLSNRCSFEIKATCLDERPNVRVAIPAKRSINSCGSFGVD